jgi:hypothetical protein
MAVDSLKDWARETAPTLTDEEWCETRHTVTMAEAHGRKSITDGYLRSRALLAYRDEVAAGVSRDEHHYLTRKSTPYPDVIPSLYAKGLLSEPSYGLRFTPFGRAVARALEAKHG